MRRFASNFLDFISNWWLTRQRPGRWLPLDKFEFREMTVTFSQCGEDIAVRRLADELKITNGFYVDAGAFHPIRASNTLLLHKSGWRGINIEMVKEKVALFDRLRPLDRNICAVLDREERVIHFSSDQESMDRIYSANQKSGLRQATTRTLSSILEQEGLASRGIDYLNIDCEGSDLRVLQGLDLSRYPVRILTIEALDESSERDITGYLAGVGMIFVEKIKWTLVFRNSQPRPPATLR
jgi:FkbM family methyltransferase